MKDEARPKRVPGWPCDLPDFRRDCRAYSRLGELMKPDWSVAPEWAAYLAMDRNGDCYWHSLVPKVGDYGEWEKSGGRAFLAGGPNYNDWEKTLEERPA